MANETFISFPNFINNCLEDGIGGIIFSTTGETTTIKPISMWDRGTYPKYGSGPLFHATRDAEVVLDDLPQSDVPIIFNRWLHVDQTGSNVVYIYCTGSEVMGCRWQSGRCKVMRIGNAYTFKNNSGTNCHARYWQSSWFRSDVEDPAQLWAENNWRLDGVRESSFVWTPQGDARIGHTTQYFVPITSVPKPANRVPFNFKFGEYSYWYYQQMGIPSLSPLSVRFSEAFYDAIDCVPDASCNTVATIIETAASLGRLFKGDFSSLRNLSGQSLWLQYRYVVNTTRMDIAEYRSVINRLISLSGTDTIKCYGSSHDSNGIYRCTIELSADSVLPQTSVSMLKSLGVELSLVNAWDMIPYSFVVDWFLHIGDILDQLDKAAEARRYRYRSIWYSADLRYGEPLQTVYLRFQGTHVPNPNYFSYRGASGKTLLMRTTDAVCLIGQKGD